MKNTKQGFTLVETMISLSLGLFILGAASYLMIQAFSISRASLVDYYVSNQGRVLRERLSRGIDGSHGLRDGLWDSVDIQQQDSHAEKMYFGCLNITSNNFWMEEADTNKVLIGARDQYVAYNSTFNTNFSFPIKKYVNVTKMSQTMYAGTGTTKPRYLESEFYLSFTNSGVVYTNYYVIKTTMVNE